MVLRVLMVLSLLDRCMIIIVGGESDVHGMARHAKREVGFIHSRKHYVYTSLVQNAVYTCCAVSVKKSLV